MEIYKFRENKIINEVVSFFEKRFFLLLLIVTLISFGQTLWMGVWLDDQGLFFKFAHIYEKAGYLGIGPIGEGLYKYVITPFIPIYKLFGYQIWIYFLLGLVFYYLAVLSVYFVFKNILGEVGGRVAGFLYAAGYIASDGIIRIITTILTSLGIIFSSFWLFFYWKFYKEKTAVWYIISILFYILALEFSSVRTHYLLAIVVGFEVLFLMFRRPFVKSILLSVLRIIPFFFVYRFYFGTGSTQDGRISDFIAKIMSGDFYLTYGGLSTYSGLFIHDWIASLITHTFARFSWLLVVGLLAAVLVLIFRKTKRWLVKVAFSVAVLSVWWFAAQKIFSVPALNLKTADIFLAYLGGSVLFFLSVYGTTLSKNKGLYYLFLIWSAVNVAAYGIYTPNVYYTSISRYLAHSFLPAVGLLSVIFIDKKTDRKITLAGIIVIAWGFISLGSAVNYQRNVLLTRSFPVERFYSSLRGYVGGVKKGDIFYFSVTNDMRDEFNAATTVASMPESTSIAWRYGVDRYDIYYFTDFNKLTEHIMKDKTAINNLHAFYYSAAGLADITGEVAKRIKGEEVPVENKFMESKKSKLSQELILDLENEISGYSPNTVSLRLRAAMPMASEMNFGGVKKKGDKELDISQILDYSQFKTHLRRTASTAASSYWRDEKDSFVLDGKISTNWRADRVAWTTDGASLTLDLKVPIEIDRFVWINAFGNSTPTKYSLWVSRNGKDWTETSKLESVQRIDTRTPIEVKFEKVTARFVRMDMTKTLNEDAPGISEVWVVPSGFDGMDIKSAEAFLEKPFDSLPDMETFLELVDAFGSRGSVRVYWSSDGSDWETSEDAVFDAIYDGVERDYEIIIPATAKGRINKLKLGGYTFPGTLEVFNVSSRPLTLGELN